MYFSNIKGGPFDRVSSDIIGMILILQIERGLVAVMRAGRDSRHSGRDHGPGFIPICQGIDVAVGST
jgi:hypothetical protein